MQNLVIPHRLMMYLFQFIIFNETNYVNKAMCPIVNVHYNNK